MATDHLFLLAILRHQPRHDQILLSVRLTNSVRTLSVKEVKRGMRPARPAQTDDWQTLQARFPTFRVMQEDGWAGLRDLHGNIMQESLFALRENLLVDQPQSQTNVLVS